MKTALQTLASTIAGTTFFAVALFLPAWTLQYWQAWVFIAVFMAATLIPACTSRSRIQLRCNAV